MHIQNLNSFKKAILLKHSNCPKKCFPQKLKTFLSKKKKRKRKNSISPKVSLLQLEFKIFTIL